jgi:hypothetical protein
MKFMFLKSKAILCIAVLAVVAGESKRTFIKLSQFHAPEAKQGVAVNADYIFVINNREISKYDKQTFKKVLFWKGEENGPVIHLNSGVVVDTQLFCAHSNYSQVPMTSSIEIWDTRTLTHTGSHSFGIYRGSCTWVDRFQDSWWIVFANYDKLKPQTAKGTEYSTLVRFDDNWREIGSWTFPPQLIELFRPMSNSGGSWGPDNFLYCGGHDRKELYVLRLPFAGSVLELIEIVPCPFPGQGFAWDRFAVEEIYGINRTDRLVLRIKMVQKK